MTFREAYERTGRALNVSVIPHDQHSPTKLLNHLTAPDCVIWSAISKLSRETLRPESDVDSSPYSRVGCRPWDSTRCSPDAKDQNW